MKNMHIKKLLFAMVTLLCSVAASAHDFEVDGIYYNITSTTDLTVEVTYKGSLYYQYSNEYSGDVVIPSSVSYNGKTYSVTSIGNSAFQACSSLTSITIPNSVTSIRKSAFEDCKGLTSITIPNSVTSIGDNAFAHCYSLTSVTIPNSVTSIGSQAFNGCNALTSVTIPNSVTSIGWNAFSSCRSLTSITIPNSVTSIEESAFSDCSGLTSITIPNSVTIIRHAAFKNCIALTSVTIPNSVTTIGQSAFSGCSGLTSVTIPNSVTTIDNGAFVNCIALTSITIPNSVTSIGDGAFNGCIALTSITIPNSVTSIGDRAFYSCDSLTSITIPNSVTTIEDYAFSGCSGLTSITIPNSVTTIRDYAFNGCTGLTSITIPNSVTTIRYRAFYNCRSLDTVTSLAATAPTLGIGNEAFIGIPATVTLRYPAGSDYSAWEQYFAKSETFTTTIAEGTCGYNLTWVLTSDSTLTISGTGTMTGYDDSDNNAPWYDVRESIKNVIIEDSVTSIGEYAFYNCSNLANINIPESITAIGRYAFYNCSNLANINMPKSITAIGGYAFYGCTGLKEVHISDLVAWCNMELYTWSNPLNYAKEFYLNGELLTDIIIPENVTAIKNEVFAGYDNLKSVTIHDKVTSIGGEAFSGCDSLTNITIPGSVTSIGQAAFNNCNSLTSITIPENVTTIGNGAFIGCENLNTVTSLATTAPTLGKNAFSRIPETATLRYPAGSDYSAWEQYFAKSKPIYPTIAEGKCGANVKWVLTSDSTLTISGSGAMKDLSVLTSSLRDKAKTIVFEESVTSIGSYAFWECKSLEKVIISPSVTNINQYAFSYCDKLTSIVVEEGNTVYDSRENCNAIIKTSTNCLILGCKTTVIPNSVTGIFDTAFQGCTGITELVITNNITSIGSAAFSHCTNLEKIVVEEGHSVYDSRENCNGIIETATNTLIAGCKNTIIPESVTSIDGAFSGCTGLTSIDIPESVTTIGDFAFDKTGLTSIVIPQNVTSIGECAFDACSKLTMITSHIPAESLFNINSNVFRNINKDNCTLYVPCGAKATYAATDGWNEFTNIVEISPEISISVDSISTPPGRSITLPVSMTNSEAITAFQIDIEVPEGIEFVSAALSDERKTTTHYLNTSVLANGKRRIIAYSNNNTPFKLNEGTLLNINLDVPKETENGDYKVNISNIRMVMPNSNEILLDPISANINVKLLMGDANDDNDVTMGDVVSVANYILELLFGAFNFDAADINGDGEITMGDLVAIINIILYPEDYDYGRNAKRGVMAASGSALSMPDTRSTEEAVSVPVSLSSTMAYTAFQMDIELPEGAKLASATASERAAAHSVAWSCLPDGKMRVVAYSLDNEVFSGNAGELVALNIEAEGAVSGAISVENVLMVTATGDEYAIGNCGSLLDINGTTGIDATDGNSLKVYTADGALIVESGKAMKAAVYSVNGKLVKTLEVAEGKNVYEGMPAGTYVVAGVKVAIK